MLTDAEREAVYQKAVRQLSDRRAAMEQSFEEWGEQARQAWYRKHDAALMEAWRDFRGVGGHWIAPWGCHD